SATVPSVTNVAPRMPQPASGYLVSGNEPIRKVVVYARPGVDTLSFIAILHDGDKLVAGKRTRLKPVRIQVNAAREIPSSLYRDLVCVQSRRDCDIAHPAASSAEVHPHVAIKRRKRPISDLHIGRRKTTGLPGIGESGKSVDRIELVPLPLHKRSSKRPIK